MHRSLAGLELDEKIKALPEVPTSKIMQKICDSLPPHPELSKNFDLNVLQNYSSQNWTAFTYYLKFMIPAAHQDLSVTNRRELAI